MTRGRRKGSSFIDEKMSFRVKGTSFDRERTGVVEKGTVSTDARTRSRANETRPWCEEIEAFVREMSLVADGVPASVETTLLFEKEEGIVENGKRVAAKGKRLAAKEGLALARGG
jgi:hypothetical protein